MAIAFGSELGTGTSTTSGTTVTITTTADAPAGALVVVSVATDNASATTPTFTCSDNVGGNTWVTQNQDARNATAAAGIAGAIMASQLTNALPTGTVITVTLSNAVAYKAANACYFTGAVNVLRNTTTPTDGSSNAPSLTTGSADSGDLVVGVVAAETRTAVTTWDTDTTNGSWATGVQTTFGSGTDTSRVQVDRQYKITSGAGTQTYNLTIGASTDWAAMGAVFEASLDTSAYAECATVTSEPVNPTATPAPVVPPHHESTTVSSWTYSSTITIPVPSNAAAGDVMVVALYAENSGYAMTAPDGTWTQVGSQYAVGTDFRMAVFWKRLTGADSGNYVFTSSGGPYSGGTCSRFTGVIDTGDPIDAVTQAINTSTSYASPANVYITPNSAPTYAYVAGLNFGGDSADGTVGPTSPDSSWVELYNPHTAAADLAAWGHDLNDASQIGPVQITSFDLGASAVTLLTLKAASSGPPSTNANAQSADVTASATVDAGTSTAPTVQAAAVTAQALDATATRSQRLVGERNTKNDHWVTNAGGTYQLRQVAHADVTEVELLFDNFITATAGTGDVANTNGYTIGGCYIVTGSTTPLTLTQVTFGGSTSVVVSAGGSAVGRATVTLSKGQTFWVRTYVTPTGGSQYPGLGLGGALYYPDELCIVGSNVLTNTSADFTTFLTTYSNVFGPVEVSGIPSSTHGAVGILGDSIAEGIGDTFDDPTHTGFAYRALVGQRPFQRITLPGENTGQYLSSQGDLRRAIFARSADHVLCQYGINDMQTGENLATCQSRLIGAWQSVLIVNPNARIYQTTITPKSSSTDGWVTVGNQTTDGLNTVRVSFNAWLRDGAPMLNGVAVATGSNEAGTLRAGDTGHPLRGYTELADAVESARDSGLWQAGYTGDGIHPNSTGHVALAGAVSLTQLAEISDVPSTNAQAQVAAVGMDTADVTAQVAAYPPVEAAAVSMATVDAGTSTAPTVEAATGSAAAQDATVDTSTGGTPTLLGATTNSSGTSGGTTSVSVTLPTFTPDANTVIGIFLSANKAETISNLPAGYSQVVTDSGTKAFVFSKAAVAGDSGSTFTCTLSASGRYAIIAAVWSAAALDASVAQADAASTTVAFAQMTNTAQDTVLAFMATPTSAATGGYSTFTAPSGYTEDAGTHSTNTTATNTSVWVGHLAGVASGAYTVPSGSDTDSVAHVAIAVGLSGVGGAPSTNANAQAASITAETVDAGTSTSPTVEAAQVATATVDATVATAAFPIVEAAEVGTATVDATTQTTSYTDAPAQTAEVAASSADATWTEAAQPTPGAATATAAGADVTGSVGATVQAASSTAAAADPGTSTAPTVEAATVTAVADVNATTSSTAYTNAQAQAAEVAAADATASWTEAASALVESAAVGTSSADPTVSKSAQPVAQAASSTAAAADPGTSTAPTVEAATVTAVADVNPTTQTSSTTQAAAQAATGTIAAADAQVVTGIAAPAQEAAGAATAYDVTALAVPYVQAQAGSADVAAATVDPTPGIGAAAGTATSSATAADASVQIGRMVDAALADVGVTAWPATGAPAAYPVVEAALVGVTAGNVIVDTFAVTVPRPNAGHVDRPDTGTTARTTSSHVTRPGGEAP